MPNFNFYLDKDTGARKCLQVAQALRNKVRFHASELRASVYSWSEVLGEEGDS